MPSRYLKLQNLRKGHAADSLVAAREMVRAIRPTDPAVPRLYAQRILEADDDWGTRDGLVVQGDGVTWEAIEALFDLAIAGGRAHRAEHPAGVDPKCAKCRQFDAVWAVQIAEPIRLRRGLEAGTELIPASLGPAQ
jgi:hypothetical protein